MKNYFNAEHECSQESACSRPNWRQQGLPAKASLVSWIAMIRELLFLIFSTQ